jgi:hypothetical protein
MALLPEPIDAVETSFKYGGYIKLDAMTTYYSAGPPAELSPIRDFHIPALIPVGADNETFVLDFHVKESRFNFQTLTKFDDGRELKGFLEMDFLLSLGGNERVSNSFNPRLRHFFFETGPWLFGQTWFTFMIVILPDDLDFIGAPDGIIFGRQPQIRYTRGPWQIALENAETTVTLPDSEGGLNRVVSGASQFPDLVGRRNFKGDWGSAGIAGILREIRFQDDAASIDEREIAYGLTLGSQINIGKDDLKFQASAGNGLGRYAGLNFSNAALIDTATGKPELIGEFCGFIAYRHFWNESKTWRSTLNVSGFIADNPSGLDNTTANRDAQSYSINLLHSPVPKWTIGIEYFHATRALENGTDGSFDRLQFSARFDFGYFAGN